MNDLLKKPVFWIFAVFAVAVFMRFFWLTKYPVSLSMDEVAIGYNAYSVLKTGRDEHRDFLPLAFKSVGDYKPPVNIYLTVISEYFLGLSEFAVRAPVALIGALTSVFLIFLLKSLKVPWAGAIFGGFWVATVPWHVHFSRGSFEAVTALFSLIAGSWLFIKWMENKKLWTLVGSVIFFSISVWAYHAERFFVPVLVLFLIILFRKDIIPIKIKIRKQIVISLAVLALFAIPFLKLAIFTPAIAERVASTSILREPSLAVNLSGTYTDVYTIARHWMGKYLNYFDLRFWFWEGMQFTPPGYPDTGLLYAIDLPLFLFGLYHLVRSKNEKLKRLALFWFFAGPLSASFTMNEQHPLRALTWLPFFGIVIAVGFDEIFKLRKKIWFLAVYSVLLLANVIYFADIYINHFPRFYSESWQYGYKQVAEFSCKSLAAYDKIMISDTFGEFGPLNTGLPYLYVLFYCPADRENFLMRGEHFTKFVFRRPNKDSARELGKLLLMGSFWDFLDGNLYGGKVVGGVKYPRGTDAFIFVEKE